MNSVGGWAGLDAFGFRAIGVLLSVLWQSSILLVVAAALTYGLRRRRAAARFAIWAGAMAVVPLLPLLGWLASGVPAPKAEIPVMPAYTAPVVAVEPPPARLVAPPPMYEPRAAAPVLPSGPAAPSLLPLSPAPEAAPPAAPSPLSYPWALALLAYVAGACLLLGVVVFGRLRMGRWVRRGRTVTDPRIVRVFAAAAARLGLVRRFALAEHPAAPSPLTVGLVRPVVLLPQGLAERLSDEELQAVALHELAHVGRRDASVLLVLSCLRAGLFFHPLVWLACRQVSMLAEAACDDVVLSVTGQPVSYARMLARLAEELPKRAVVTELAAGFVLSKGAFLARIEAILSHRRDQIRRLSRLALAGTLLAAAATVVLALALPLGEKGANRKPDESAAAVAATGTEGKPAAKGTPTNENPAAKPALPGSVITDIRPYVPGQYGYPVVAEAVEAPMPEELEGGWHHVAKQEFKVIESPWDKKGDRPLFISYQYRAPQEEPIAKGRRVLWIGYNPRTDSYSIDGVKAYDDTPQNRQAVTEAFGQKKGDKPAYLWPQVQVGGQSMLWPGSAMAVRDALQRRSGIVALCLAGPMEGASTSSFVAHTGQRFKVLQMFEGDSSAAEAEIAYMFSEFNETWIPEGAKVIWIAEPWLGEPVAGGRTAWIMGGSGGGATKDGPPFWQGLKVFRDTPENRRMLSLPEAGKAAPARPAAKPAVPLKRWTDEEMLQRYGTRKGDPIDTGFVFVQGKYVEAPYTVRRQGADILVNDTHVMYGAPAQSALYDPEEKPPAPAGLGRNTTFADLDLPGTQGDSWDRQMVRWILGQHRERYDVKFTDDVLEFYKGLPFIKDARYTHRERDELALETVRGERVTISVDAYAVHLLTRAETVKRLDSMCEQIEERLRQGDSLFWFDDHDWQVFVGGRSLVLTDLMVQVLASGKSDQEKADLLNRVFVGGGQYGWAEYAKVLMKEVRPSGQLHDRLDKALATAGEKPRSLEDVPTLPKAFSSVPPIVVPASTDAELPQAGSKVSLDEALKVPGRLVVLGQALEMGTGWSVTSGDMHVDQLFRIVEVLAGRSDVPEAAIGYNLVTVPFPSAVNHVHQERWVAKGEKVIWIAEALPAQPGDKAPRWKGLKALADTPENRKEVADAAKAAGPAMPGATGGLPASAPAAAKPALPGSVITDIRPYVPGQYGYPVVAEAVEDPKPEEMEGGWHNVAKQEFKVIEFPLGKGTAKTLFITYQYKAPQEESIAKGRRVLWVGSQYYGNENWFDGLKAFEDTPETRKAVAEALAQPAPGPREYVSGVQPMSGGTSMLMHGWDTAVDDALACRSRIVVLCQTMSGGSSGSWTHGPTTSNQPVKVLQVFEGDTDATEAEIFCVNWLSYPRIGAPLGENTIWIVEPMLGIPAAGNQVMWWGEGGGTGRTNDGKPWWNGLKAFRDTPENRRLLGLPAAGTAPPVRLARKPTVPLKVWPEAELIRQYGESKGKPIDSGFLFVQGRYIEPPYTVRRQAGDIFVNDTRVTYVAFIPIAPNGFPDKPAPLPGLGRDSKLDDLLLPGTLADSWDRQMVRYLRKQNSDPAKFQGAVLEFYKGLPFIKEARWNPRERNELLLETVRGERATINLDTYGVYLSARGDRTDDLDRDCKSMEDRLSKGDAMFYYADGVAWVAFGGDKAVPSTDLVWQIAASRKTDAEKADLVRCLVVAAAGSFYAGDFYATLAKEFQPSKPLRDRLDKLMTKEGIKPQGLTDIPGGSAPAPIPTEADWSRAGSNLSPEDALKPAGRIVAVCEALDPGAGAVVAPDRTLVEQRLRVAEVLAGRTDAREVLLAYTVNPDRGAAEQWMRLGEKCIWVAEPAAAQPGDKAPRWKGLKALADTPENRKEVAEAAKAAGTATPGANGGLPASAPVAAKPTLPGSTMTDLGRYFPAYEGFLLVAEAAEEPQAEELEGGWYHVARQPFKIIESLGERADAKTRNITYNFRAPAEEAIAKGRRVIWMGQYGEGIKAFDDTPAARETVAAVFRRAEGRTASGLWRQLEVGGREMLLPGSSMALSDALHRRSHMVILAQAVDMNGMHIEDLGGDVSQKYKVLQALAGGVDSDEAVIHYRVSTTCDTFVDKDQKVLWIVEPGLGMPWPDDPDPGYPVQGPKTWWSAGYVGTLGPADKVPHWIGLKALRDTPQNRRLLGVAESGPTTTAVSKRPARGKLWTQEETARELGDRKGKPVDAGFVFVDGRYVESPYTVSRRGAAIYVNDVRLTEGLWAPPPGYDHDDKKPAPPPGLGPDTTFDDLNLPDTWYDSWDRRMVRWIFRQINAHYTQDRASLQAVLEFYKGLPFIKEARWNPDSRTEIILETVRGQEVTIDVAFYEGAEPTRADMVGRLDSECADFEAKLNRGDCLFFYDHWVRKTLTKDQAAADLGVMAEVLASGRTAEEKQDLLKRLPLADPYYGVDVAPLLVKQFRPSKDLQDRLANLVQATGAKPLTLADLTGGAGGPAPTATAAPVGETIEVRPPVLLPGSEVALAEALKGAGRIAAVCEALDAGIGSSWEGGRFHVRQMFRVSDMLSGRSEAKEVVLDFFLETARGHQERWVAKGEKCIWVAEPESAQPGDKTPRWKGLKALADTPENRKAVDAAKAAGAGDAFLAKAAEVLAAVAAKAKDDPALKPLATGKVENGEKRVFINVKTDEWWDGFPTKGPERQRGQGHISLIACAPVLASDRLWTPYIPPKGCFVGHNWLAQTKGPGGVLVSTNAGDPGAHARLVKLVLAEFARAGVEMKAEGEPPNIESTGHIDVGQPPPAVAKEAPADIVQVRSLAELKARPEIAATGGWFVRLGWADSGPDGGPWKILYCWAEYGCEDGKTVLPKSKNDPRQPLGPVRFQVTNPDSKELLEDMVAEREPEKVSPGMVAVFAAVVPVAWKGEYCISVFDAEKRKIAETVLTIDKPESCPWQALGMLNPVPHMEGQPWVVMAPAPEAVYPTLNGNAPVWSWPAGLKAADLEAEKGLPGQVPTQPWWMPPDAAPVAAKPGVETRGSFPLPPSEHKVFLNSPPLLHIEDMELALRSVVPINTDADLNLAARWWVNDRPVAAVPAKELKLMEMGRLIQTGTEVRLPLVLPQTLGQLKAGDKIGLQILYSPSMVKRLPENRDHERMVEMMYSEAINVPLLSNRLDFAVTDAMLKARPAPAAETPAAAEDHGLRAWIETDWRADGRPGSEVTVVLKNVSDKPFALNLTTLPSGVWTVLDGEGKAVEPAKRANYAHHDRWVTLAPQKELRNLYSSAEAGIESEAASNRMYADPVRPLNVPPGRYVIKGVLKQDEGRADGPAGQQPWVGRIELPPVTITMGPVTLPPALEKKRDELLAQADQKIRQGLLDLAKTFPSLALAWNQPLEKTLKEIPPQPGRLAFDLLRQKRVGLSNGYRYEPASLPEAEKWFFCAEVDPFPGPRRWPGFFCPHLNLTGNFAANTDNADLRKALSKLIDDAVAPLRALDAEVAKGPAAPAPATDKPGAVAAEGFKADIGSGSIRLLAVGRHPPEKEPGAWWQPDGSKWTEGPFETHCLSKLSESGKSQAYEFVVQTAGLPDDAGFPSYEVAPAGGKAVPGSSNSSLNFGPTTTPGSRLREYVAAVPVDTKTATLRIGVAVDPWKTLAGGGKEGSTSAATTGGSIILAKPTEADGAASVVVSHTVAGGEVRVVAVDLDGKEHTGTGGSTWDSTGLGQVDMKFAGLPLEKVREFRFQARPYRWVEFRDVSLAVGPAAEKPTPAEKPLPGSAVTLEDALKTPGRILVVATATEACTTFNEKDGSRLGIQRFKVTELGEPRGADRKILFHYSHPAPAKAERDIAKDETVLWIAEFESDMVIGDDAAEWTGLKALADTPENSKRLLAAGPPPPAPQAPAWIADLKDKDRDVRFKAIDALGKSRDSRGIAPLIECMSIADDPMLIQADRAAGALATVGAAAVEPLIAALKDKDEGVRFGAAVALGLIEDKRALEPLLAALKAVPIDPEVEPRIPQDEDPVTVYAPFRQKAALALAAVAGSDLALLLAALKDPDPNLRAGVVAALGATNVPAGQDPCIAVLRQDKDPRVRAAAARALVVEPWGLRAFRVYSIGQEPKPKVYGPATEPLIEATRDESALVRAAAAVSLRCCQDPRAPDILKGLLKDKDRQVRWAAVYALSYAEPAGLPDILLAVAADKREDPWVRHIAIQGLEVKSDERVVGPLLEILKDADADVRESAAYALHGNAAVGQGAFTGATPAFGPQATAAVVTGLLAALKDPEPKVRVAAATALGHYVDPRIADALLAALKDADPTVRGAAISSVETPKDGRAVELLIAILGDKKEPVHLHERRTASGQVFMYQPGNRATAARTLGGIRDPRAVEPLIAAAKDPDVELRREAVRALAAMGDLRAVDTFLAALKDADRQVRFAAIEAAAACGDPRVADALKALLSDPDENVRSAAQSAFEKLVPAKPAAAPAVTPTATETSAAAASQVWDGGRDPATVEELGPYGNLEKTVTAAELAALKRYPNLKKLELLRGNHLAPDALAGLKELKALKTLQLDIDDLTGEQLKPLRGVANIKTLIIAGYHLTEAGMQNLVQLDGVEELEMYEISDPGLLKRLAAMKGLKTIRLHNMVGTPAVVEAIGTLRGPARLELHFTPRGDDQTLADLTPLRDMANVDELWLWGFYMSPKVLEDVGTIPNLKKLALRSSRLPAAGLPSLVKLTHLEYLQLIGSVVTDAAGQPQDALFDAAMADIGRLTTLTALYVDETPLSGAGLARLGGLVNLEHLQFQRTHVTDDGTAVLEKLVNLKELQLWDTNLGDETVAHLAGMQKLETLSLGGLKGVTDKSMATVGKLAALKTLALWRTSVTDAGVLALKGLANLKSLDLRNLEGVTDPGMAAIGTMTGLERLELDHTAVTDAGIPRLKDLKALRYLGLEGCNVNRDRVTETLKDIKGLNLNFGWEFPWICGNDL